MRAAAAAWRERPSPAATPFTFGYVTLLAASTLLLWAVDDRLHHQILAESSTDLAHLESAPLRVLVASALWLPSLWWWAYPLLFSLVLSPVERRIGGWWTLAVFATGHVIATLLTELPLEAAIDVGWLPASAAHRLDVGVSYGFYAVLAVLVGMLTRPRRLLVGAVAVLAVALPFVLQPDVTSTGHLVSLGVGVAWWPWLRRRRLWGNPAREPFLSVG